MRNNLDALAEVVRYIYDNIQYAEFNTKSDYCHVCGYDGEILINDTPADSIMSIMALGITKGTTVIVSTHDAKCWSGVDRIADAINAGLD